jgi:hypothetical protein
LTAISRERAERIARAAPCPACGEYSFKKLKVAESSDAHREALGEVWHATKTCGVCGNIIELGIDAEGEIVYGE